MRNVLAALLLLLFSTRALVVAAETLREAGKDRLIGCAIAGKDLNDPKLRNIIQTQFSLITPEYEFMPEKLVNEKHEYTFNEGDKIVDFAAAHNAPVIGHMLVWHFITRKWFFETPDGKPLPRDEALANMKDYVEHVVGHYKGKIKAWDVVNEGLSDNDDEFLKSTPALRAIGEDYIEKAFEDAHAADPDAELFYNDYNIEQPAKREKAIKLVKSLQAKGLRIDAIGVQGHWQLSSPPVQSIDEGITALAKETGLKVMITELDVDPLPRVGTGVDMAQNDKGPDLDKDVFPPEMQKKLADRYYEIVSTIVKHPEVTVINFWGTHDGRSWLNDHPAKGRTNHPLLLDRNLKPKPAFDAVIKALKGE